MASPSADKALWPAIGGIFDLTLHFEESFLDIPSSAIFTLASALVLWNYRKSRLYFRHGTLLGAKLASVFAIGAIQAANIALRSTRASFRTETTIPALSLDLLAAVALGVVLYVEHRRAIRSSAFVAVYLLVSIFIDVIKTRSFFSRQGLHALGGLATASACLRGVLLGLEEIPKTHLLIDASLQKTLNRETVSGYWSRALFLYLNPLFLRGARAILKLPDLGTLSPEFASKRLYAPLKKKWQKKKNTPKHKLFKTCFSVWKGLFFVILVPRVCNSVMSFSQPFILYRVIALFGKGVSETSTRERVVLLLATIVSFVGQSLTKATTAHLKNRLVTRIRGALICLLLDKSLHLSQKEATKSSALTLMSTDIEGITEGLPAIQEFVITALEVGFGVFFLSRFVGRSCFTVLVPLVLSAGAMHYCGKWMAAALKTWNGTIESRVAKTSKIVGQLTAIKMFGLGATIEKHLQGLRETEIAASKKYRNVQALAQIPLLCADLMTPVVVIAAALFWRTFDGRLSAATVFPSLSIIVLVKGPLTMLITSIPSLRSMLACFDRLQDFLLLEERKDPRTFSDALGEATVVRFDKATLAPVGADKAVLKDVSFDIKSGSINGIVGSNGSGKSLLLQSALGETELLEGAITLEVKDVGYCGQNVWLRNASVKDNIIGPRPYNERLFNQVLKCSLLEEDIKRLPGGVEYVVGTGGAKLSGGQRQRLALARTLFAQMSLVLLDDVFSSLDRKTALSILVRLCGPNGFFREYGTTVILTSYLPEVNEVIDQMLAIDQDGHVTVDCSMHKDNTRVKFAEAMDIRESAAPNNDDEKDEESLHKPLATESPNEVSELEVMFDKKRTRKLYRLFFGPIGMLRTVLWSLSMLVVSAGEVLPEIYMRIWIEIDPDNNLYFIGYASIAAVTCVLFAIVFAFLCNYLTPRAALSLHQQLARTVVRGTIAFLGATDKGVLVNRFSQDMSLLARNLPISFMRTVYIFWTAVIQTGITASGGTYMSIVIPFIVIAFYFVQKFYLRTSRQIRALDLETKSPLYTHFEETAEGLLCIRGFGWQAENLERGFEFLEESQKAFYCMACIQQWLGLVIGLLVAALGTILIAFALFTETTSDSAIGLAFFNLMIFGQTLEILIIAWTGLETSVGALARLQEFMETTPREPVAEAASQVPERWPSAGHVEFENVSAQYNDEAGQEPVLRSISLAVPAGTKMGLIGRTGSGKSSLFLALLGFLRCSGAIKVDGIDISTIPPDTLRSRVVTVSQDQIKLEASIRVNLLPFTLNIPTGALDEKQQAQAQEKDAKLRALLERLGLWSHLEGKSGLDTMLDDAGYSHGEMQLFCLARGILRHQDTGSKLVLMDEVTSSVAHDREGVVQELMKEYFADCTVLVIGHRKSSVQNVDLTVELSKVRPVSAGRRRDVVMDSTANTDNAFWPPLQSLYDVTLKFEETISSTLSTVAIVVLSPVIVFHYLKEPIYVRHSSLLWVKLQLLSIWWPRLQLPPSFMLSIAIRASTLLSLYLLLGVFFDAMKSRSFFIRPGLVDIGALAVASSAIRLTLVLLEEVPKTRWLIDKTLLESIGPEGTGGYLSRTFFVFLNPLFLTGYRTAIAMQHLSNLGPSFSSEILHRHLKSFWNGPRGITKSSLAMTCFKAWKAFFLAVFIPRLLASVFSFAQPFLLYLVIEAVDDPTVSNIERGLLVGATATCFIGSAVAKMTTAHMSYRQATRVRGGLIAQISDKNLHLSQAEAKKSAAVTLMSNDVDGIAAGLLRCYDIIVTFIEVNFVLVPLVLSTIAAHFFGKWIAARFTAWDASIQSRVAKTSRVLGQIQAIKMFGLGPTISTYLQQLRVDEIDISKGYRGLESAFAVPVVCAELITPVVVVAAAVFWKSFDGGFSASTVFPSLSLIALIKDPLAVLLLAYPSFTTMVGCFERVETFLRLEERADPRIISGGIELADESGASVAEKPPMIQFVNANIGPPGSQTPILHDLNFTLRSGSTTGVAGPNGSGKSLLLQSILGETELINGTIRLGKRFVAFCSQLVWLRNVSLKDNIIGSFAFDAVLFEKVIKCCLLAEDIAHLAGGVDYIVGSGWLQTQWSSLDRKTARSILLHLCGENGLLKELQSTVVIATYLPECLDIVDQVILLDGNGHAKLETNVKDESARRKIIRSFNVPEDSTSEEREKKEQEDIRRSLVNRAMTSPNLSQSKASHRFGDWSLYGLFLSPVGKLKLVFWLLLMISASSGGSLPDIYMRVWIDLYPENNLYFIGYAGIAMITCFIFGLCGAIYFIYFIPRSANGLHERALDTVLCATIGFLGSTDNGVILNRFSQDMSLIAQRLPLFFIRTVSVLFQTTIQTGVIVSGSSYMAVGLPLIAFAVFLVQRFYLRTSRQVRALDLEARSPLYTHFEETAEGLLHIRAFGSEQNNLQNALKLLDASQKAYYYQFCVQQWLGIVLGLLVAATATILVAIALFVGDSTSQTAIGLSFLNLILFAKTLEALVTAWTGMETCITGLERLRDLIEGTPQEQRKNVVKVPESWPSTGDIELSNVSALYDDDETQQNILKNICLSIPAGQKVGIVGRTGSGKSSLFLALLGFLKYDGTIKIDGIDISAVPFDVLRSRIVVLSQDRLNLDATIRINLLPFTLNTSTSDQNEAGRQMAVRKDAALQHLLTRLGIWMHIDGKGGLDANVEDAGYSHGEMQLFCLARAIQRCEDTGSKVVLIDEATSSVEDGKEKLARGLMKEYFAQCTVLVIGHKESSLRGVDYTVALSQGEVVQDGSSPDETDEGRVDPS
ncbi:hypothetical protein NLG97_g3948 [Lecanicillium saksenae]|uniref:Uncharacterized protein n=1 Tax=Lecanicillium saksenae TaxID=468837 RepID=A0ACC1QXU9_9HYPO|nr:hypothetical protein NLG97_g3948 [Lecanicillium saksenae]